jgi:hypothetical protein
VRLGERARAREAPLRAEQVAEAVRLTDTLRDLKKAHATEFDRWRTKHADSLWRLVEVHWHVHNAVRATLARLKQCAYATH